MTDPNLTPTEANDAEALEVSAQPTVTSNDQAPLDDPSLTAADLISTYLDKITIAHAELMADVTVMDQGAIAIALTAMTVAQLQNLGYSLTKLQSVAASGHDSITVYG